MIDHFQVSSSTDGKTQCRIFVEPGKHQCSITVTVDRRIVRQGDENDISTRSFTERDWFDIETWSRKAGEIAKAFSPFWRGETAA